MTKVNEASTYTVPQQQLALTGPVHLPNVGLPIRGDLAHIALAERYLVAHYVAPQMRTLRTASELLSAPREDAEPVAALEGGASFELLDIAGRWAWGCLGPEGPAGYLPANQLSE